MLVRSAECYCSTIFGDAPANGGEVIALVHVENFHYSTMTSEQWLVPFCLLNIIDMQCFGVYPL